MNESMHYKDPYGKGKKEGIVYYSEKEVLEMLHECNYSIQKQADHTWTDENKSYWRYYVLEPKKADSIADWIADYPYCINAGPIKSTMRQCCHKVDQTADLKQTSHAPIRDKKYLVLVGLRNEIIVRLFGTMLLVL